MGAYVKKNFFLVHIVVLILLAVSSYARFGTKITKSEIHTLCTRKSVDSSLCFEVVGSTPGIATLDFSGLSKYLINYDSRKTSDMLKQFQALVNSTTDPFAKGSYHVCAETFDDALYSFDTALVALAAKDYDTLNVNIAATTASADTCSDELSTFKSDPNLRKGVSTVDSLSAIILSILECDIRKEKVGCD